MKPALKVLWHENSNTLAAFDLKSPGLPLLSILDDEYKGINPFYAYPLLFLVNYYGWIEVGEL